MFHNLVISILMLAISLTSKAIYEDDRKASIFFAAVVKIVQLSICLFSTLIIVATYFARKDIVFCFNVDGNINQMMMM